MNIKAALKDAYEHNRFPMSDVTLGVIIAVSAIVIGGVYGWMMTADDRAEEKERQEARLLELRIDALPPHY